MRKYIALLAGLLYVFAVVSQNERETIVRAHNLIENRKYETAFKLLEDFDPNNGSVDIVLLKEEIALNYYIKSMMHQLFSFKNMDDSETLSELRSKEGSFNMHTFKIDKVLDSLINIYPDNCKLYQALGDFYYEAQVAYNGKWLINNDELFNLIEKNYSKAIEKNCADYLSYYVIGYINLGNEKYKECIPYFLKSIKLNGDYTSSSYNLAFAYMKIEDYNNALKYAKTSFDQYEDPGYKGDAARMIAEIYTLQKEDKNALKYYELADKVDPNNYDNLNALLEIYVKTSNTKTKKTLESFYNLDPDNPTIYNDLEDIYFSNNKSDDLISFYKEELEVNKNKQMVTGNLDFYLGRIYLKKDTKQAKDYFTQSKDSFSKILAPDDEVFKVIEEEIKIAEKN